MRIVSQSDLRAWRKRIGLNIRAMRHREELTQPAVAKAVGVTVPMISHIETGRKTPNLRLWLALAKALGVHPCAFYNEL